MTAPSQHTAEQPRRTDRRHRAKNGPGMWVTDGELIDALGVPADTVRPVIAEMDSKPAIYGFPPKVKQWGDRRYKPAVEAWFEARYGLKMASSQLRRVS